MNDDDTVVVVLDSVDFGGVELEIIVGVDSDDDDDDTVTVAVARPDRNSDGAGSALAISRFHTSMRWRRKSENRRRNSIVEPYSVPSRLHEQTTQTKNLFVCGRV